MLCKLLKTNIIIDDTKLFIKMMLLSKLSWNTKTFVLREVLCK